MEGDSFQGASYEMQIILSSFRTQLSPLPTMITIMNSILWDLIKNYFCPLFKQRHLIKQDKKKYLCVDNQKMYLISVHPWHVHSIYILKAFGIEEF